MRPHRDVDKYFEVLSAHRLRSRSLTTNIDIADDIYSGLSYFADVPEVGRQLLVNNGVPAEALDDTFFGMQSFIRQSRSFYKAARNADPRSSSLIYYYAFLNLAKAVLCLHQPEAAVGRIHHGLGHRLVAHSLDQQEISILDDGVFPRLYEIVVGEKIPKNISIDVFTLLTYCADVSFEVESSKPNCHCTTIGYSRGLANTGKKEAYAMIAAPRIEVLENCKSSKSVFYEHFEEVSVDDHFADEIFRIRPYVKPNFRFFELIKSAPFENDLAPDLPRDLWTNCYLTMAPGFSES